MSVGKFTCKYWPVCGSRENCAACRGGYEVKGTPVVDIKQEGDN